jgi:predicted ATPase/DNA-binding CsgD family transcriptional regulator
MHGVTACSAGNLPAEMTALVGRRRETAQVKRLLSTTRLVTLTGVGGVGKSRLALHVAREMRRQYRDGVWLVELTKLHEPSLLAQAMVDALGLPDQSTRDSEAVLAEYLAGQRLMLVLDNCEHVLAGCRPLVSTVLARAPRVTVLATSRESLAIAGECAFTVPPLSVPPPSVPPPADAPGRQSESAQGAYEALTLFEVRASAATDGFALGPDNRSAVVGLCQRLEGLPLAIELAAVRTRALSVQQILDRLEDRYGLLTCGYRNAPARHQTLRSAVEWSFDLCSDAERAMWARASVFAGGFDLDAAESVCAGDDLPTGEVLGVVRGLIDKSVFQCHQGGSSARYRMLETLREYGCERLAERGEADDRRRRHRDYYLRLAERADADSFGPGQARWLATLHEDRPNLWVALEYCLTEPGQARAGLRMAGALWAYWVACGRVRAGRYWLGRMLAADDGPSSERARALWVNSWIACLQGEPAAALEMLDEGRPLAARLGDADALTRAVQFTGTARMFGNDVRGAVPLQDAVLARDRASGRISAPGVIALIERAHAAWLLGDAALAESVCREGKAVCEAHCEQWTLSWVVWLLGRIQLSRGDLRGAGAELRHALEIKDALNDELGIPFCIELLAWVAIRKADFERAAVLLGTTETMWETIGVPLFGFKTLMDRHDQSVRAARHALGGPAFDNARLRGTRLPLRMAVDLALNRQNGQCDGVEAEPAHPRVTRREREVASLVAHGLSNQEIAKKLVISRRTAECHIAHLLDKLGFTSRSQIAAWIRG